jgi:hypothetical protein
MPPPPATVDATLPNVPTNNDLPDDDQYISEEDSDFDIDAPVNDDDDAAASDSDASVEAGGLDEGIQRPSKRRKIEASTEREDIIDAELDSGDEATIRKAREKRERKKKKQQQKGKKKKKKHKNSGKKGSGATGRDGDGSDDDDDDGGDFDLDEDDEGGEGGFVRTRGMRMKLLVSNFFRFLLICFSIFLLISLILQTRGTETNGESTRHKHRRGCHMGTDECSWHRATIC